jgi:uncharacterized protein (DUF58 family)
VATDRLTFPLIPVRRSTGVAFGTMRSRRRGIGSETASFREYQPGDDIRRIDWNGSARLSAALGRDEFVVREHYAEQARGVYVAVDRSASMGLYPEASPWLSKPRAVAGCATLIAASARSESCPFGFLDEHGLPRAERLGRRSGGDALLRGIRYDRAGGLTTLLADVARPSIPAGSFVFLLSDFVEPVELEAWQRVLAGGIELVPVLIQDPLLERSFPAVGGVVVPVAEPGGRRSVVRLSRKRAQELRERNERRLRGLHERFDRLGLDWVDVQTDDLHELQRAFFTWADARRIREAA